VKNYLGEPNKYEDIKHVDFSKISFTISYYHINLSKVNQKKYFYTVLLKFGIKIVVFMRR